MINLLIPRTMEGGEAVMPLKGHIVTLHWCYTIVHVTEVVVVVGDWTNGPVGPGCSLVLNMI